MDDIVSYNDWLSPMMRNEYAFLWIDESVGTHICFKASDICFKASDICFKASDIWFKALLELV